MTNREIESLDEDGSLWQLLKLATAEPDEALLRRYAQLAKRRSRIEGQLSAAEVRWVETNLRVNPLWKRKWRQIQKDCRHAPMSIFARGGVIAACLLSAASLLWIETVHNVRSTTYPDVATTLQGPSTALRSVDAVEKPHSADLVVDGAWTLLPTARLNNLSEILVDLQQQYQITRDPFKKAEFAFRIARLNEIAGDFIVAVEWYEVCKDTGSSEYGEQAATALVRLRARLPASYRKE
jgi:hypothetical protein